MSSAPPDFPPVRRQDKLMSDDDARDMLATGRYGRFECDVTISHRSVVAFGRMRVIEDHAVKQRFCDGLMAKYHGRDVGRPKSFYPRLDHIAVYAIAVERLTGKETKLPAPADQWPARDRTMTPDAKAP